MLVSNVLCWACRGQEPSTAPALDFSWMTVLWQQAFGHNNPQVAPSTRHCLYDTRVPHDMQQLCCRCKGWLLSSSCASSGALNIAARSRCASWWTRCCPCWAALQPQASSLMLWVQR